MHSSAKAGATTRHRENQMLTDRERRQLIGIEASLHASAPTPGSGGPNVRLGLATHAKHPA
jgi:hypothetical protein